MKLKHIKTPFIHYQGMHIVECLNSRQNIQGYMVKRMPSDDYAVHMLPSTFATEAEAKVWIDTEYDPQKITWQLTKEDKAIYTLK